ncbi:MAG TPA: SMI1/KNR4 family protein [Chitinophaga sp.]|uniref:SMI1/KNR4 family protein n=1 Tax=Chitinophaga sp. TaxID=1869181 RepID=UPI002CF2BD23|nr:SMI1/KNR4 family protein [Chitinophaga sp.]HVI43467.1 SMI1/KNR4 family protein [Chitinophaga sp.]
MQDYWTRWENWMQHHAPPLLNILNPGVNTDTITSLERLTGTALPADFKNFYAIHNGQQRKRTGLIDADQLLPVEEIIEVWHRWQDLLDAGTFMHNDEPFASEPDTGIRNNWWNPKWIPITSDGFDNHLCIDMDPAPEGRTGQVIAFWHDDGHREVIAPSFRKWVDNYVSGLEKGEYVFIKKWGIVRRDTSFNYND